MPKSLKPKSFEALQKEWYGKLKDDGFSDIEQSEYDLKRWDSLYFRMENTPGTFEARETYFQLAGSFLHTNEFSNSLERMIWEKHTEGLSVRETVTALAADGIKTYKKLVHNTVVKLKRKMLSHDSKK